MINADMKGARIYLDMCSYNRPYDDQSQLRISLETQAKLQIQDHIKDGSLELIGSYTLDYECSRNPYEMRRESIRGFIDQNMKGYVGVERDDVVSSKAKEIMSTGVKEKDAQHIASAIYAKCKYFITTDDRLFKYDTDEIKIVSPIDFVSESEVSE